MHFRYFIIPTDGKIWKMNFSAFTSFLLCMVNYIINKDQA